MKNTEVVVMEIYFVDFGDGDWKAIVDGLSIETKGYCDSLNEVHVVESTEIEKAEFDEWSDEAWKRFQASLKSGENITFELIHRPLGRCYGNSYWKGLYFEHLSGDRWSVEVYRGSNTWGVWQDIGMTGAKTDATLYVKTEDIEEFFEDFFNNPPRWAQSRDVFDWVNEMRSKVDYSFYAEDWNAIRELLDLLHEYDCDESAMAVLEVWDTEDFEHHLVNDLAELDDEDRRKFLDYLEKLREEYSYFEDEEETELYELIKTDIKKAKTLGDVIEAFGRFFQY